MLSIWKPQPHLIVYPVPLRIGVNKQNKMPGYPKTNNQYLISFHPETM